MRRCHRLALLCATLACATAPPPGPLNRAALRASHPRTILATLPPIPPFQGKTSGVAAGAAMFGVIGAAAEAGFMESEGKKARAKHVVDPADGIAEVLIKGMSRRFSLQVLDAGRGETVGRDAGELSDEYPKSDLVLDVRTSEWGFVPTKLGHYDVRYEGSLNLVDTRSRAVIATGTCVVHPVEDPNAPTYDELMANQAAVLKDKLRGAAQFCADEYRTRVLGLFGQ